MDNDDLLSFQEELETVFPASFLRSARELLSAEKVTEVSVKEQMEDEWYVEGVVEGPKGRRYRPGIVVNRSGDFGFSFDATCTCMAAVECAHAAAVLLSIGHSVGSLTAAFEGPLPAEESPDHYPGTRAAIERLIRRKSKSGQAEVPPANRESGDKADPAMLGWVKSLERAATPPPPAPAAAPDQPRNQELLYVVKFAKSVLNVVPRLGERRTSGSLASIDPIAWKNVLQDRRIAACLLPVDREIIRDLCQLQPTALPFEIQLADRGIAELLPRLIATGRCYLNSVSRSTPPLTLGEPMLATLEWKKDSEGNQRTVIRLAASAATLLPSEPLWYLDPSVPCCGPVTTTVPPAVAAAWLSAPRVPPEQTVHIAGALKQRFPGLQLPEPEVFRIEVVHDVEPTVILVLHGATIQPDSRAYLWDTETKTKSVNLARLDFEYLGQRVTLTEGAAYLSQQTDNGMRRIYRSPKAEATAEYLLRQAGLVDAYDAFPSYVTHQLRRIRTAMPSSGWLDFVRVRVPAFRKRGWRIEEEPTFSWRLAEAEDWFSSANPVKPPKGTQQDWFGVELGVVVDGERINLLPLLVDLLKQDRQALSPERLAALPHGLPIQLPSGKTLLFPVERARSMLGILIDLFDDTALGKDGRLRLPKLRAAELAGEADWRWLGPSELGQLAQRLRDFRGIQSVPPPADLRAELRPYQQEGLDWLQFLREHELGGVLADDMGLGKTIQAIAHLLAEKESGRANRPSLVVAPTSLMTNWRQECQRFAPSLKVLVLHGLDRKDHFEEIPTQDVVLTTYPLLPRDLAQLQAYAYHCLILDEAQYIKNPRTGAAQAAHQLDARHRLCLSGTPIENHLGELWSLFHFLMPGFLGDDLAFNRVFRRPIEKDPQCDRRAVLARRVAPFMLRRRKEQVARELPAKSEIIQNIELAGAQRDLYETVRLAMHERVKEEVGKKGLSRSHIIILDALLKLRQICCHPQLLDLPAARNVQDSAKMELLFELVPSLIEEGRRILLFSQFTSMLALIETELDRRNIPYVILTGDTTDRATPVNRFQAGEVPLFLLSLKAGGTGLNLTAADTVIHYDPWWNPAVENQATDRAHRIGQDKQVFVYKLLTVGTVEEKISALQARKRELVEGLLGGERPEQLQITPADLEQLFAPVG